VCTTAPPHHSTTAPPHHCTTALLHHCTTTLHTPRNPTPKHIAIRTKTIVATKQLALRHHIPGYAEKAGMAHYLRRATIGHVTAQHILATVHMVALTARAADADGRRHGRTRQGGSPTRNTRRQPRDRRRTRQRTGRRRAQTGSESGTQVKIADLYQGGRVAWQYTKRAPGGRRRKQRNNKRRVGRHMNDTCRQPVPWTTAGIKTKIGDCAKGARTTAAFVAMTAGACLMMGHCDVSKRMIRVAMHITTTQYAIRATADTMHMTARLLTDTCAAIALSWKATQHARDNACEMIDSARRTAARAYMYTMVVTATIAQSANGEGGRASETTQAIIYALCRSAATRAVNTLHQPLCDTGRDVARRTARTTRDTCITIACAAGWIAHMT
jgi:hypothetical protein